MPRPHSLARRLSELATRQTKCRCYCVACAAPQASGGMLLWSARSPATGRWAQVARRLPCGGRATQLSRLPKAVGSLPSWWLGGACQRPWRGAVSLSACGTLHPAPSVTRDVTARRAAWAMRGGGPRSRSPAAGAQTWRVTIGAQAGGRPGAVTAMLVGGQGSNPRLACRLRSLLSQTC